MLQWQDQMEDLSVKNTAQITRALSKSISSTIADLKVAYGKFNLSDGDSNRYTIESQTSRYKQLIGAADGLLDAATLKQAQNIYERDLAEAYEIGSGSSRELSQVVDNATTGKINQISKMPIAAQAAAGQTLMKFWDKEKTALTSKVTEATLSALQRGKGWSSAQRDIAQALRSDGQTILRQNDELSVTARNGIVMNLQQRADLIARTELANAYIGGQIAQYKKNGYEYGRWSATGERTCPFCVAREGAIYSLDELESSIPAHPRCRCTIAPILGENMKKVQNAKDKGAAAASNLDDAGWTAIRQQRFNEYFKFSGKELKDPSRYLNAPTSRERFLRPGRKAAQPAWLPSGQAVPDPLAASASASRAIEQEKNRQAIADLERQRKELEKVAVKEKPDEEVTFRRHSNATGGEPDQNTRWTAERTKLHNEIIEQILATGVTRSQPKFTMSGGGPASGKGFMLEAVGITEKGKPKKGQVVIDADEIKKLIPEYSAAQKKGGTAQQKAASNVHEESSYLTKRIMAEGAKRRFDMTLDGTGDSGLKSLTKKVQKMKDAGYRVEAKYVSADTELAALRNWDRFVKTGRLPPEWMLRNVHRDVSITLPEAMNAGLFDKVELFDTNLSGNLRLVASKIGKKSTQIADQKLWDDFKRKGEAKQFGAGQESQLLQNRSFDGAVDNKASSSHAKHSDARAPGAEPNEVTRWTVDRQKLHMEIVNKFLSNGVKSTTPTFTMSGGGPASGKGFMLKATGLDQPGKVVIDADEIKKLIPEYADAQKKGGKAQQSAAGYVHEESSYLAKRIMSEASKRNFDVVLDGTGDSGIKSLEKKVQKMRDQGYRVEAKYVSADTNTAAQRNWDRFLKTGRLPPEYMLRNVHADVSRTLPEAIKKGIFDKVELYDTNSSGELRKVISQVGGKTPKIHDQRLWDDFKRKGEAAPVNKEQGERMIEARKLKVDDKATSSHAKHSNARGKGAEPGPDTVWTLERQRLHQDIVDEFLANGVKSASPTFTMSGGGPASGKGFMLKATGLDQPGKVVIDADEIKKLIPEYADAQKKGGKAQQQAAGYVHEESSYLSKRIMSEAAKRGFDVVLDGTGDSGIDALTRKVQKMRDMGYKVEAKYVSADTDLAADRNWDRFLKTGRLPPEFMLRNVHADVSRTLPKAIEKGLFDAVDLYDTNVSGQLRKVVSQVGGKGLEIVDKTLWEDFKRKGNAAQVTSEQGAAMIELRKAGQAAVEQKTTPAKKTKEAEMVDRATRMKTSDVLADPSRFQYKVNSNSKTGEVGSLSGVKTWNEDLAGVLSVWKDPANGKTYVINGHNRLALAKKLGAEELPVVVINAKDAKAARSIGAKQNIANGDGTAIDAAKFMRDTNTTARSLKAQGLNLKGSIASDGAALANLPNYIFNAALEGRLSISRAAAIGRSGLSIGQMDSAYKVLKTKPSMSVSTLDEVLANARASMTRTTSEETLFGTSKTETSTLVERADLAAKIKGDMGKEIRILDKAAGRADVLNSKGNRIDVGKAQVKAAEAQARLEIFELTKNSQGSNLNRALNEAASAIQDASGRSAKTQSTKAGRKDVEQALDAEIAAMRKSSIGLLRSIADLKAVEAGKVAKPPELALLAEAADLTIDKRPVRLLDPKTAKAGAIGALKVDQIKTDPKRFQYKAATDAATGEVGSLEGVQRFDPNLAGVISVWKDPTNGQTYVINGHNRLAAAKRLGADDIAVRYLKADSAADARSIGALANIAEGHGTALDAAKFMRAKGFSGNDMKARGIAMKKDVARNGAALANLPETIFADVVNENISIEKASAIGSAGLDQKGMDAVYRKLRTRQAASIKTVTELVAAEKMSMEMGSTGSLFAESADDVAYQMNRADLTGKVRDDLMKEKSLFKAVSTSRAARELEKAGSTLDLEANSKAAAQAETILSVFDQLKNSSGPLATALSNGARDLATAKTVADKNVIRRTVMDEITKAVDQELRGNLGSVNEPPPETPGQESLFGF